MANTPAILAEGLHKSYGKIHALGGLDLAASLIVSPPIIFLDEADQLAGELVAQSQERSSR